MSNSSRSLTARKEIEISGEKYIMIHESLDKIRSESFLYLEDRVSKLEAFIEANGLRVPE